MKAYARTHTGNYRELNEDNWAIVDQLGLAVVADGIGGHLAGEVASQIAVTTLVEFLQSANGLDIPSQEYLRQAVMECNNAVYKAAREDSSKKGMGTTLTSAIFYKDRFVLVAHVGDSRAYLYRGGRLSQITRDHSLVGELLARGAITKQEAMVHPHRNIITRALGTNKNEKVDVCQVASKPGDIWLICSDGLSNSLCGEDIEEVLSLGPPWDDRADSLLEFSLEKGGHDNITFIIVVPDAEGEHFSNSDVIPDAEFGKTQEIPVSNRTHATDSCVTDSRVTDSIDIARESPQISKGGDTLC